MICAFGLWIAQVCENQSPLSDQVDIDASLFGARRVKGKRKCSAYGKKIVFGLIKRPRQGIYPYRSRLG